jgi:hypothetical protein
MEFVIVGLAALLAAVLVKYISNRILSGEDRKTVERQNAIAQGVRLTAKLAGQAEKEDFINHLGEIDIKVEEIGAYGAKLIGLQDEDQQEDPTAENSKDDLGEHVILNLRWKNTGEKTMRCVTFAVAFISPNGEIICPDALDPNPWLQQFGCAAAVKFTGHFEREQGRLQKDMRNPFLLYHAPVENAVILGVQVEYDNGQVREKMVSCQGDGQD